MSINNPINPLKKEAVTSLSEVYSTEETRIGTWIDGKPLYRKVLQGVSGGSGWISLGTLDSAARAVMLSGYLKDTSENLVQIPYQDELGLIVHVGDPNIVSFQNFKQTAAYNNCPITAVIEYTKTTDPTPVELEASERAVYAAAKAKQYATPSAAVTASGAAEIEI